MWSWDCLADGLPVLPPLHYWTRSFVPEKTGTKLRKAPVTVKGSRSSFPKNFPKGPEISDKFSDYTPLTKTEANRWAMLMRRNRSVVSSVSEKVQSGKSPDPLL